MSSRFLRAEIWTNNSDGEPGRLVATSRGARDESTFGSSFQWVDFAFESDFVLEEDQSYHLVLSASDTIELESSVDFSGRVIYTDRDYSEEVDLKEGDPQKIVHGIGNRDVMVFFFDNNNQVADIGSVRIVDSNIIEVESGSDVSGTVVIREADYSKEVSLVGGGAETYRHNLNDNAVLVQSYDDNGEMVNLSHVEQVGENNIEVESALDFDGKVVVSRSVDSELINLEAGVTSRVEQFGGSALIPVQVWNRSSERVSIGRIEMVDSSGVAGSVWDADSESGEFDRVFKSNDGENWSEDTTISPTARIYTADIPVVAETRKIDLERPGARKQVRKIVTNFNLEGNTFFVDVIADGRVVDTIEIEGENTGALWNDFFWNEGFWGGVEDTYADPSVKPDAIGNTVTLRIRSTQARDFKLISLSSLLYVRNPR